MGGDNLILDLRLLDERVEDVEDRVARPDCAVLGESCQVVLGLASDLAAPEREARVLVHKLVDAVGSQSVSRGTITFLASDEHVVEPVDGETERNGSGGVEDEVEEGAVVVVGVESVVEVGLQTSVDVAEVQLSVQSEEHIVCGD